MGLLLPYDLTVIYVISTDDPIGIENYWHARFATLRRGKSEFFDLGRAEVAAFKRRRFM